MRRLHRLASAVAVLALLVVALEPAAVASAASSQSRRKQEQVRAQRAKKAKELDALKASDRQLERAVADLAAQLRTQSAKLSAARQAVSAADATVRAAEANIARTEGEITALHGAVVDRAVAAYMRPEQASNLTEIAGSRDLGEASRRAALMRQVANSNRDVIDELRAKREDLGVERERAAVAKGLAQKRRDAVDSQVRALNRDLDSKARLERQFETRIREIQREAELLEAEDARITDLIRRSAQTRASRGGDGDDGGRVSGAGLVWPVRGPVTSEFGSRWGRLHAGIDISAPRGTPIRAAKGGVVIAAGYQGGYGNCVIVDHGGGFSTLYAHMSRIGASDGSSVGQGEVLGYVGSTGHSTGNHLHFETRVGGSPQNPRRYL